MKTARNIMRNLAWTFVIIAISAIFIGTAARQVRAEEEDERFRKEELVQMLAPIALYPDSLIAQMLMASTYPLEVVEAERWLRANSELKGDDLSDALREKPWDPSVKSLCYFPDVLFAMSDKLEQTRRLGDAFLAQEQEVMATIQELRRKAQEQGYLKTTEEQKVIVEREIIRIEPASPTVVYVPVYDPYYVYGPWWYPAYLPYYWYYPPLPFGGGIYFSFGPRIFISTGFFSWVWFDWYVHRIYIDVPRTYLFHRYTVRPSYDRYYWRHDPRHRRGIAYRDRRTSEQFGVPPQRLQSPRPETRGYPIGTVEEKAPAPSTTAPTPTPSREQTIAPKKRLEQKEIQPGPPRETKPSAPSPRRERTIAPEPRLEPKEIQPTPPRETKPSAPAPRRERAIAPEPRLEPKDTQPAPPRETKPSAPSPRRERTIAPEPRLEPQKVQPPPARVTPPSAPAEKGEPEKIQPSPGRDTTSRGINEGSIEKRGGERGEKSRRSGETKQQDESEKHQEDTPGRGDDRPRR